MMQLLPFPAGAREGPGNETRLSSRFVWEVEPGNEAIETSASGREKAWNEDKA